MPQYAAEVEKLQLSVAAEKAARDQALEAERKLTASAQAERDAYKAKLEFCESAKKATTKGKGFGCIFLKIITLGISGCH